LCQGPRLCCLALEKKEIYLLLTAHFN
jgi:hypothetical protein